MDAYEATRVVFSRIQNLDPENASKIMGLLLIQDHGEKEMIRLAFGPESLLHSVILKAKKDLGFSSNGSTPSSPSSPYPIPLSRQNSTSSRFSLPSPLSIPNPSSSWANSSIESAMSPSLNSSAAPFYGSSSSDAVLIDEYNLQEHLSFLNDNNQLDGTPNALDKDTMGINWGAHRRSCSVNDICLNGSDDAAAGFGWKPCLYYARGYCKNGSSCRFVHGGELGEADVAALSKLDVMEQCQELLRSKSAHHQQRLAAAAAASQLLGTSPNFGYNSSKCMNFLLHQPPLQGAESPRAAAAAALLMGEEMNKFGRSRLDRNEFAMNGGMGMLNPGSRQIYLTFPADSTFREEDVSNYFSIYGPVQDVRIPYQQKRMFGFVTFVYPETVKLILAKGNPHFVCDARVLVKPYKEKGKVPDKFRKHQQQQMERGEFPGCGSPTGFDSRDPFDVQLGARMLYNSQDLLWRRKLEEQAELQQAIELQNRRLMSLQLLDVKRNNHHRTLSMGSAIPSPVHSPNFLNQSVSFRSDRSSSPEAVIEESPISRLATPGGVNVDEKLQLKANVSEEVENENSLDFIDENGNRKENEDETGNAKSISHHEEDGDLPESLEHNLPDNLFASPKASGDHRTEFSSNGDAAEVEKNSFASLGNSNFTSPLLPATTLDVSPFKSCYFQVPRFASGHGAIGM